jgi:hypothetical protein
MIISIGSDNFVELSLSSQGVAISNASVSGSLLTLSGSDLADFTFTNLGNGLYEAVLPYTATTNLTQGTTYIIQTLSQYNSYRVVQRTQVIADYAMNSTTCATVC